MMRHTLTPEIGACFVGIALGHVTRECPIRAEYTPAGPEDIRPPSEVHPVFCGSYDWHSCVHSYWLLARLLRLFPAAPQANATRAPFDKQLLPEKVAGKCACLAAPTARAFKRPYGWAWLLKLANKLAGLPDPRWSKALKPLTESEPGGDDFQSSALIEAECVRRLLPASRFLPWFDRVLSHLAKRRPLRFLA